MNQSVNMFFDAARKLRQAVHVCLLLMQWAFLRSVLRGRVASSGKGALVIPVDPAQAMGSRGDEAMLAAVVAVAKRVGISDIVAAVSSHAPLDVEGTRLSALRWPSGPLMPLKFARVCRMAAFSRAYVMGADMIDGYYSPVVSLRLIIAADLLARVGTKVAFLGFSFNAHPSPCVVHAFKRLHPSVAINVRDPASWRRLVAAIDRKDVNLVADTAFLLEPALESACVREASSWCRDHKSAGRAVIGINVHGLLFEATDRERHTSRLIEDVATALGDISARHSIAWLLVPHDDRPEVGDLESLERLHTRLLEHGVSSASLFRFEDVPRASDIKGLMRELDGIVSARMHLAIAALGSGLPVLVFAYQGKFEGLLEHFALPLDMMLDARHGSAGEFANAIEHFVGALPTLTAHVQARLPGVLSAARATYG